MSRELKHLTSKFHVKSLILSLTKWDHCFKREPLSSYLKTKLFANFWRKRLFLHLWPHSFLKISEYFHFS